ncbi:hypothetical protein LTR09_011109 [Extremus antarcticus]|uniref:Glutathione S-transferase n=1 Tax=Extremus antarcticus TaxID=702011 RepID=A0AAJ0D6T7_9PEZI|nr:hypothetical protein LTR09_011109 [Extremus antarcticus]
MAVPEIILFDYQYAPNAQRARNLLNLCNIPYKICEQPFVQPRPILQDLGITYRRIPVNSIGKDVYCDNRVFLPAILDLFKDEPGVKALVRGKADYAYEAFGYRMFWVLLDILPDTVFNEVMVKDRADLFGGMGREDYRETRPSNIEAFKEFLDIIENEFLAGDEPFIAGEKPGIADLQVVWIPKFALETIAYSSMDGQGMGAASYPKLHAWLKRFEDHTPENEREKISGEEASRRVLAQSYAETRSLGVEANLEGVCEGDVVDVVTTDDTRPGNMAQRGRLVGLDRREIVVVLGNGGRVHFSRIGYAIKKVAEKEAEEWLERQW